MKKLLSMLLSAMLVFAAVPSFAQESAPQWLNSNVVGNVTADMETSYKDDFHLAVNKDWLLNTKVMEGQFHASTFTVRGDEVRQQALALIQGEPQTSHEGKLVQQLYKDYTDMDARNERGMAPVMPFIEEIQKIQTLDELTAYMLRNDQFNNQLYGYQVMADLKDSTHNALYFGSGSFTLKDADEYRQMTPVGERRKQAMTGLYQKLLERIEYSPEEATALIEQMYAMETQIALASQGSSAAKKPDYAASIYNPITADELALRSPTFPMLALLQEYTNAGVESFVLTEVEWLDKMNELYTPENIEGFKAMLICNTLHDGATYLDQTCIDLLDEASSTAMGMPVKSVLTDDAYAICSENLGMAIGKMYTDEYVSPETKKNVQGIIADVVKLYKNRLSNMDWMSEETRQKAIEKLDHLRVRVAYPDDWSKYDVSDIVLPENGTLIDDMLVINKHLANELLKSLAGPIDLEKWVGLAPQMINAFYNPTDNSINIMSGALGGVLYTDNGSIEQILGGVGTMIAHEITHGFDTMGSQYDKDGNFSNWWTDEDFAAFVARTDKVNAYFSSIEALPGQFVDGQLTIGETVADLGALSCMLEMAKGYENFDYATFFEVYARIWPELEPMEVQQMLLMDSHAPGYLRTNVTVQQFQEFYDTFEVVEGDGMYLAPERRLTVW
ncbi:MAG: M13 family metallopeptidase [Clostridia bacterium]